MYLQVAERYGAVVYGGEEMLSNADVTFFSAKTFERHTANKAYFTDNRGQTLKKNGIEISDAISVYLYTDEYIPKAGDIVVRGIVNFSFDTSTKESVSGSMKLFRQQYPDFAVVKSVSDYRFGGLPHIEITAR